METQSQLIGFDEKMKFENIPHLKKLNREERHLENEKHSFLDVIFSFSSFFGEEIKIKTGRPKFPFEDIIKSLLIMAYHGFSYRRAESDIIELLNKGIISYVPKRSTLNKYMCMRETTKILEKLIQISAMLFIEHENTIILDSTWLATKMYRGGHKYVSDKKNANYEETRKLHIACLKNSKIIAHAKTTKGSQHDSLMFQELVSGVIENGFHISSLLADAGYTSKDSYALCEDFNIRNVFIDFRSNASLKNPKSFAWKRQLTLFKENPKVWKENYRYRVFVEQVFSTIKRKQLSHLRARIESSQDNELLLKCLVYNFTIIGKYT